MELGCLSSGGTGNLTPWVEYPFHAEQPHCRFFGCAHCRLRVTHILFRSPAQNAAVDHRTQLGIIHADDATRSLELLRWLSQGRLRHGLNRG